MENTELKNIATNNGGNKKTLEEILANRENLAKQVKDREKQKKEQKIKSKQSYKRDKDNYFSYYDDIKVGSHKIVDW